MRIRIGRIAALLLLTPFPVTAQSTQAYLTGTADDSVSGHSIPNATISCRGLASSAALPGHTDAGGRFTFAALSPGSYSIRIDAPGYQSQELRQLDLPIAARLELHFHLRPENDVWEARQYQSYLLPESKQVLTFYGPDLDTSRVASFETSHGTVSNLETSVSSVIDSHDLNELPLTGRDAYALLVLLPGVTADTATSRGLGFSVNGQRPSSANYLLDGLENNNMLVTGPLGVVVPEDVSEYRISTNDFSAEFGRTSGFLANAISRAGDNDWHGMAYLHLENELLDANGFQENVQGIARAPLKQIQPGFNAAGPILRKRLFASGSLQLSRFHGRNDPQIYALPTARFIASATGLAGELLKQYPAAAVPTGPNEDGLVTIAPPVQIEQATGLMRLDYLSGAHRIFARTSVDREHQPDLLYNPYPQFSSPLHQGSVAIGAGWTWQIGSALTQELRAGRTGDAGHYDRPHSEIPILNPGASVPSEGQDYPVSLPGSTSTFGYRNLGQNWELVDDLTWIHGRHSWKFGGGLLIRTTESAFLADRDGLFQYRPANSIDVTSNLNAFAASMPATVSFAVDGQGTGIQPVPYNRDYRYTQFDFFAQDAFRVTPRLTLNYGIRYDRFGAPLNTGSTKDVLLAPGAGANFSQSLETINTLTMPGGNQQLFATDNGNLGVRFGFAYALPGGNTVLRGSYGIFYDRPYDNLWQMVSTNRQVYESWSVSGNTITSWSPAAAAAQGILQPLNDYHYPEMFQPGIGNPIVQSAYVGIQQKLSDGFSLELNVLASRARRLWSTDVVNRQYSVALSPAGYFNNPSAVYDPAYGNIDYTANQGLSNYQAFTSTVRFRKPRLNGQASYTWSHSIDNQSDPLAGIFENFNQSNAATKPDDAIRASFTQQFDSNADRANSDFDQRQNLVFFAIYEFPQPAFSRFANAILRDWQVSGLGALRSGLPFSALYSYDFFTHGGSTTGQLLYPHANLVAPALLYASEVPNPPGGVTLLNVAAFAPTPGPPTAGNVGRNAFTGPGLVSADLSISRHFALGERRKLTLRADFYNALNHANLNNPEEYVNYPNFGQALYGREEKNSGFPLAAPFNEASRVIQLFLRVEF